MDPPPSRGSVKKYMVWIPALPCSTFQISSSLNLIFFFPFSRSCKSTGQFILRQVPRVIRSSRNPRKLELFLLHSSFCACVCSSPLPPSLPHSLTLSHSFSPVQDRLQVHQLWRLQVIQIMNYLIYSLLRYNKTTM